MAVAAAVTGTINNAKAVKISLFFNQIKAFCVFVKRILPRVELSWIRGAARSRIPANSYNKLREETQTSRSKL